MANCEGFAYPCHMYENDGKLDICISSYTTLTYAVLIFPYYALVTSGYNVTPPFIHAPSMAPSFQLTDWVFGNFEMNYILAPISYFVLQKVAEIPEFYIEKKRRCLECFFDRSDLTMPMNLDLENGFEKKNR